MPKIKLIITPEKEKIFSNVVINGQVLPRFAVNPNLRALIHRYYFDTGKILKIEPIVVNPNLRALIKRHYFDTGKILKIEGVKIEVLKYE